MNDAKQFRLRLHADRTDFVEKDRPLIGHLKQSTLRCDRACECAPHMAKQRAFQKVHRHAAAVHRDKCFVSPRAFEMDGFRHKLLACATLPLDEDRTAARRHLANDVEHSKYLLALTDNIVVAEALLQRAAKLHVFAQQLALLDRVGSDDDQLLIVPRLCDVIEGSFFGCRNGSFHSADCSNNNDRQGRIDPLDLLLYFHAGLSRQHQVEQNGVIRIFFNFFQALFAVRGRICGKALRVQQQFNAFSDFLLIVNDEDHSFSSRHSLVSLPKAALI